MSQIEDFDSTLKEVVQAKRLSASKMAKLTELAMKLMTDDTQLVSILYRTHKSLSASAKVSSLYVFDALARAAKHQANKQNLAGDINASEGNCSTFLLKLQGILDGLFKDMVLSGTPEAKEKTKKVLDIWVKGNTFPPTMLSQLADVLKDTVKEPTAKAAVSSDPRVTAAQNSANVNTPTPPPTSTTPPFPPSSHSATPAPAQVPPLNAPLDPQSKILALLTQAIHVGAASTSNPASTSTGPALMPPQSDVAQAQLALLQQLTRTAQIGSNMTYPHTGQSSVSTDVNAIGSYEDDPSSYSTLPGEAHHSRYNSSDSRDSRGVSRVYRGGRGRWNDGRGKRDGRDHFRDRERGAKRSRSRSPPSRYGARREIKPYSPPRRPVPAVRELFDTGVSQPSADNVKKDEFGRDVRAPDPESLKDAAVAPQGDEAQTRTNVAPTPVQPPSVVAQSSPSASGSSASKTTLENKTLPSPGLEQFNVATFDFTNPESWEVLGKMWLVSYGNMPTTEQLMQFVMLAGASADPTQMMSQDSWDQSGWDNTGNPYTDAQRMSMELGTNGGMGYAGNHVQGQSTANGNWTAAVDPRTHQGGLSITKPGEPSSEKRGGGMRKVGDKWIFVRDMDSAIS